MKIVLLFTLLFAAMAARACAQALTAGDAVVFTMAGGLAFGYDHWIEMHTKHTHTRGMSSFSRTVGRAGEGGYVGGLVAVCAAGGAVAGDAELSRTALLAGGSFLIANAAGTALKVAFGRSRPYANEGPLRFRPFSFKNSANSFPSGHTVSAFSVASVFAARSEGALLPVAAYGLASMVAVQRLYARRHWVSDVAAGAFIGTYVGRRVVRAAAGRKTPLVWVTPEFSPAGGFAGLRAVYAF